MNLFVRKASTYSEGEKAYLSITGIPDNWPIETIPNAEGAPPENYILMSQEDLDQLFLDNQAAYAVWAVTKEQGTPLQENYKVDSYTDGVLTMTCWYADYELTQLSHKTEYTYTEGTDDLEQIDERTYDSLGVETRHECTALYTDTDNNTVITETEVH